MINLLILPVNIKEKYLKIPYILSMFATTLFALINDGEFLAALLIAGFIFAILPWNRKTLSLKQEGIMAYFSICLYYIKIFHIIITFTFRTFFVFLVVPVKNFLYLSTDFHP